jgi:protein-L-isoaspartate(D-aspartate) O-methyltransferase
MENARYNMIEQQIRPCEVIDERVLNTLKTVPREAFVGDEYTGLAFADIHVPLGNDKVMMKPMQEGVMLQALDVHEGDRVLEVGTGSGFVTACLTTLGGNVTSYEIDEALSAAAGQRLEALNLAGADLVVGDIFDAELPEGSFDVIAVTGSMPAGADRLEGLLAPGGRMFVIKGEEPVMCATLVSRSEDGELSRKGLCETLLPPLQNAPQPEHFQF